MQSRFPAVFSMAIVAALTTALGGCGHQQTYASSSTIRVHVTAPDGDAQAFVTEMLKNAVATGNLAPIIQQERLYGYPENADLEKVASEMRRAMLFAPVVPATGLPAESVMRVTFVDPDPARAQRVTNQLVKSMLAATAGRAEVQIVEPANLPTSPGA